MKKFVYLLIAASAINFSAAAQNKSANEDKAKSLFFKATDDFESREFKSALYKINEIEKLLGGSNARVYYLKAKVNFQLGQYTAANDAVKAYFMSNPRKDHGYDEMLEVSTSLESIFLAERKKMVEEAEARKVAEAERIKRDLEEAALAEQKRVAAVERRKADAEAQKVRDRVEADDFKSAQSQNTKEAYYAFIYNHPYGKLVDQAKIEMRKKWPSPSRMLKKDKYGFVDRAGKFVIKPKFDNALEFCEDMARVGKDGKFGFVNLSGDVIVPIKYSAASNYNYGYSAVKEGSNLAYFIDKSGKPMTAETYLDAKAFSEGLAAVQDKYFLYGYINTKGEVVIPFEYNAVSWFKEGIASVGKTLQGKTRFAYIDTEGNLLTDFVYEEAKDFQNGVGRVKLDGKYGLVDKFGSSITCCEYDYISEFKSDGYALAKKNGYDLYLDKEGQAWAKVNNVMVKVKF